MKAKLSISKTVQKAHAHYEKRKCKRHKNICIARCVTTELKIFGSIFRRTFKFEGREKLSDTERTAFNAAFKAAYLHPCETYWIRRLNLIKDGYNLKESGEGGAGHV